MEPDTSTDGRRRSGGTARLVAFAALLAALGLVGCGTVDTQTAFWFPRGDDAPPARVYVYGGVARDGAWLLSLLDGTTLSNPESQILVPFFLVDVPLSLVLDTAVLPLTVGEQVAAAAGAGSPEPPPAGRRPAPGSPRADSS
jgi:uncharacterized protein YceK